MTELQYVLGKKTHFLCEWQNFPNFSQKNIVNNLEIREVQIEKIVAQLSPFSTHF